jgi:hypothetical protein
MAKFKISGVWKDAQGVITHYAVHHPAETGFYKAVKTAKVAAVQLLSIQGNSAMTWLWDYTLAYWKDGAAVEVIQGQFLRTVHDGKVSDNLAHLINYEWL